MVNVLDYSGPCFICGDKRDHYGKPHGEATGDGRVRADVVELHERVKDVIRKSEATLAAHGLARDAWTEAGVEAQKQAQETIRKLDEFAGGGV